MLHPRTTESMSPECPGNLYCFEVTQKILITWIREHGLRQAKLTYTKNYLKLNFNGASRIFNCASGTLTQLYLRTIYFLCVFHLLLNTAPF